jgi:hypothetical protein
VQALLAAVPRISIRRRRIPGLSVEIGGIGRNFRRSSIGAPAQLTAKRLGFLPEEAVDRLKQSYTYAPDGSAHNADVHLCTSASPVLRNFDRTVHLAQTLALREKAMTEDPRLRAGTPAGDDARRYLTLMRERLEEASPSDAAVVRATARIDRAMAAATLTEHLRRIDAKTAIGLLG